MGDEDVDEDMSDEEIDEYVQEKYSEWFEFHENFDQSMFFKEGIQEIMLDDTVSEFLSAAPIMSKWTAATCRLYVAPNIPKKKLRNGISNDRYKAEGLLKEDNVWAMVDERTALFSPKYGLMVTNIGIFWNSTEWGKGGMPWRINDSRITTFWMNPDAFLLGELGVVIDDEITIPIGTLGPINKGEMAALITWLAFLPQIANEQHSRI